jgi:hypothetical protein
MPMATACWRTMNWPTSFPDTVVTMVVSILSHSQMTWMIWVPLFLETSIYSSIDVGGKVKQKMGI